MYKAADFFVDSIRAHLQWIADCGPDNSSDISAEVEARLLTVALYLRLMDRHGYIQKSSITLKSIEGADIEVGKLLDAIVHQKAIKTDAEARQSGIEVVAEWGKQYSFRMADFTAAVERVL